jgi:hypothetical protein
MEQLKSIVSVNPPKIAATSTQTRKNNLFHTYYTLLFS